MLVHGIEESMEMATKNAEKEGGKGGRDRAKRFCGCRNCVCVVL